MAIAGIVIFGITNKKLQKDPLSIETKVKIAQEKCIYEYKVDELSLRDNIGVDKFEYTLLNKQLTDCLEKVNQYEKKLNERHFKEMKRLGIVVNNK